MAVGQRNAVVNVLPVFIFYVLVRKLVLYEHLSLFSPVSVLWSVDGSLQQQSEHSCNNNAQKTSIIQ